MGVMKEKLEAVMNEWNKEDEVQTNKKVPLSKKIIDYVLKNPNSTALQITNYIMRTYPDTVKANVSSILKQLSDRNHLEREYYFDKVAHRSSYKYTVPSGDRKQELEAVRKAEHKSSKERLEKMRLQAEAARAAKAAKKEERLKAQDDVGTGVSAGLSAALPAHLAEPDGREMLTYEEWKKKIDTLSVGTARALYDELKKIFGG